jgi:RNA-directed DNA polymerase
MVNTELNSWLTSRTLFDKLQVEINDEKSRTVDLGRGDSFGFLGFDFRYTRSFLRGVWRPYYTPKLKKRTALVRAPNGSTILPRQGNSNASS